MIMSDIIQKTAYDVFKVVAEERKQHGKLTKEGISILNCIFPSTLQHALDLLDRNFVTQLVTDSKRELFQVKGSSGIPYICFPSCNYCTCPSYLYTVLLKRDSVMCKHLVAMNLAIALDSYAIKEISDQEYVTYLAYETESPMKKENKNK